MSNREGEYNEDITRRHFLTGTATAVAGAAAAAAGVEAQPAHRALNDPEVVHQQVSFKSGSDTINGYLARPKAAGRHPAVLIIPGIFGVTEYMRESAAQLAQNGFAALAVNLFSRNPELGNVQDIGQLRPIVDKIPDRQLLQDIQAGIDYLKAQSFVKAGGVGVTGFCMGGRYTLMIAALSKDVKAASPYYGFLSQPMATELRPSAPMDVVKDIKVPVQGHYGATDMGIPVAEVQKFEATLKAQGTPAEFFVYPAGHAFHDYSRPSYNAEAAKQAWSRTIAFFKKHLG